MKRKNPREDEITRLIHYAKGHGLKVTIRPYKKGDEAGYWTTDGTELEVVTRSTDTKTDTVLTLIHELGHHLWFVRQRDRNPDLKFNEALGTAGKPSKKQRKKILSVEKAGTKWWPVICKDADIKLPEWRVLAQAEFDTWQYEVFYQTGAFPIGEPKRVKMREILDKWKPKKESPKYEVWEPCHDST